MVNHELSGKVAIVTGAGRGLGLYLAKHLARQGCAVAFHYRTSQEGAEEGVKCVNDTGGKALALGASVETEAGAHALVERTVQEWGRLDVVIHSGGHYEEKPYLEMNEASWRMGLASTIDAAFFMAKASLPELRKSGRGRVVMIGDSSCERPGARDLALSYHVGKTGVLMLTRSLACSEAQYGITCNCVSPGYLEMSVGLPDVQTMPSGRFGTHEDIWRAVKWLLGPESEYVNGAHLVVSGGWNLR